MLTSSVQQIIVYVILAVVAVLWIVRVARIFHRSTPQDVLVAMDVRTGTVLHKKTFGER